MCVPSICWASFCLLSSASWACAYALVFQHFPKFKRTLSVSSVYAGINAFSKSIQIGLVLVHYGNFAKYARTPLYQNYGHASSLGLNGIDHLKMVDDHGRR